MSDTSPERRSTIIDVVKTPLSFLVLGLLIVESTLGGLAVSLSEQRPILVWAIIISFPAYTAIVVALAIWKPEALRGDRPLQREHANTFAGDLFLALDGALSNLTRAERAEAWITVADVVTSSPSKDSTYANFCLEVAAKLKTLAEITGRNLGKPGPVKDENV